jgi:hypothetical protein
MACKLRKMMQSWAIKNSMKGEIHYGRETTNEGDEGASAAKAVRGFDEVGTGDGSDDGRLLWPEDETLVARTMAKKG